MLVHQGTLADHHRRCDELFAAARGSASAALWDELGSRVGALREAILAHFRYEEEHIFPLYEQWSGKEGATEWLRAQHDDMRAALWLLGTVSAGEQPGRYYAELTDLQEAFQAHARDEELRMYPVFERMLAGEPPKPA